MLSLQLVPLAAVVEVLVESDAGREVGCPARQLGLLVGVVEMLVESDAGGEFGCVARWRGGRVWARLVVVVLVVEQL